MERIYREKTDNHKRKVAFLKRQIVNGKKITCFYNQLGIEEQSFLTSHEEDFMRKGGWRYGA